MRSRQKVPILLAIASAFGLTGCPQGPYAIAIAPDAEKDVGRYWARLPATVVAGTEDLNVWFEVRLETQSDWSFVHKTPRQWVEANAVNPQGEYPAVAIEDWVYGLTPDTAYEMRSCYEEPDSEAPSCSNVVPFRTATQANMRWVGIDPSDPKHLAFDNGERFIVWGSNYVRVNKTVLLNDLVEDHMYSEEGLALIAEDFDKLSNVNPPDGALNAVRMHLQLHRFLSDPTTPDRRAYASFAKVIEMAEDRGLYIMVTGLNYFYPARNPSWVAKATDDEHWNSQALWWRHMARALKHSPGVMAYDLVNEPYSSDRDRLSEDGRARWTGADPDGYCDYGADPETGRLGTCFGQYIAARPMGRSRAEQAIAWTKKMVQAIRYDSWFENDSRHLITIGVGGNQGLFNAFNAEAEVHAELDFASPHLYPSAEDNGQEMIDLVAAISEISEKPVIVGETFTFGPVERLIRVACNAGTAQGWFGQYDGRRLGDPCPDEGPWGCILHDAWYILQAELGPTLLAGECPEAEEQ